jgi:hypothetical protein
MALDRGAQVAVILDLLLRSRPNERPPRFQSSWRFSADAVATGLAASLARLGGNVTGSTVLIPEISAKRPNNRNILQMSLQNVRCAYLDMRGGPPDAPLLR